MEDNEIIKLDLEVTEDVRSTEIDATFDVIDLSEININVVESQNAFPPIGEPNEYLKHSLMNGRDVDDHHPISAITGLRKELNEIKSLKTVYSDGTNFANYYQWADEIGRDEFGYFISFVQGASTIRICEGADIGGVTVDDAAFVGNQDNVERDNKYAMVVVSGTVDVRCESDVKDGDYVISNIYGIAQKTTTSFGYKVIAKNDKHGVAYATIVLGVQSDKIDLVGKELQDLDRRIDNAETNITSAMNVANNAYNKASETESVSEEAIIKALEAIAKADGAIDTTNKTNDALSSVGETAAQAKAIAEIAVTSAESLKKDAVDVANQAMVESRALRDEFDAKIEEVDGDINNTLQELQLTTEQLRDNIDNTIKDLDNLEKDLVPLSTWSDDKGNIGVAGFVARADEDSAKMVAIVKWQGETDESIAAFKQEVSDVYATQEMVAKVDDSLTLYKQEVEKNYATQTMLSEVEGDFASFQQTVEDDYATQQMVINVGENLTSYKQEVAKTYATQEMVTTLEIDTSKALTDYKQEVKNEYATQEMITQLETDTSKAFTDYKQEVNTTYATQESLASLKTETTNAIAASEEKATAIYASKNDLTSFEGEFRDAVAQVEQKADDNGASIRTLVSSVDKYSVGEYSQSYGLTRDQAKSILRVGMIYIPTAHADSDSHSEFFVGEDEPQEFTPGAYYEWDGEDWIEHGNSVAFFSEEPKPTSALQYWYIDSNTAPEGYESYALYMWHNEKWTKVNIYYNNPNNRKTSSISQDVDSISLEITNARGSYSGLDERLTKVDSQLQLATFWSNQDTEKGNLATVKLKSDNEGSSLALVVMSNDGETQLEGASIVLGQDGQKSFIKIDADSVNFETGSFIIDANHINFDADNFEIDANKVNFDVDGFEVKANKVNFDVEGYKISSKNITFESAEIDLIASQISMDGYVTFENLKEDDGKTEINGSLIKTGAIESSNYAETEGADGMRLNLLDGTWDSENFQITSAGNITANYAQLNQASADRIMWEHGLDGTVGTDINRDVINTGTIVIRNQFKVEGSSFTTASIGCDLSVDGTISSPTITSILNRLQRLEAGSGGGQEWNCDVNGHHPKVDPSSVTCDETTYCEVCLEVINGTHHTLTPIDGYACQDCGSTAVSECQDCFNKMCTSCGSTNVTDGEHVHTLETEYINIGDYTHTVRKYCSESGCDYEEVENAIYHSYSATTGKCECGVYCSHVWEESWSQNASSNTHRYIKKCSICGYVDTDEDVGHTYSTEDGYCACGAREPDATTCNHVLDDFCECTICGETLHEFDPNTGICKCGAKNNNQ